MDQLLGQPFLNLLHLFLSPGSSGLFACILLLVLKGVFLQRRERSREVASEGMQVGGCCKRAGGVFGKPQDCDKLRTAATAALRAVHSFVTTWPIENFLFPPPPFYIFLVKRQLPLYSKAIHVNRCVERLRPLYSSGAPHACLERR